MTNQRRPLIGSQCLIELENADGKSVYIDPVHVVIIEPSDDTVGVTCIRMYSHGGTVRVLGTPDEVALLIQQARQMVQDVEIETLVEVIREEVEAEQKRKYELN